MEKYGRVLVIIFFLILINLGLSVYILSKLNRQVNLSDKQVLEKVNSTATVATLKTATPSAIATTPPNIQSDLNLIKAEIRALRDALDVTGLISQTPEP